jgi:hypothetical protein
VIMTKIFISLQMIKLANRSLNMENGFLYLVFLLFCFLSIRTEQSTKTIPK